MNQTWRIILAILAFLACVAFGSFGGCTVGLFAALGTVQNGRANHGDTLFFVLLGAGGVIGLVLGVEVARLILKPPPPPR